MPGKRFTQVLREEIQNAIAAGVPPLQIAVSFRVCHEWIYELRLNYEAFGTVSPAPARKLGRPPAIFADAIEGMRDFLDEYPQAYLSEIQQFLKDEELRTHFRARMARYTVNQIIRVDESAANEKTKDRRHGWSLRGIPCWVRL